MEAKGKNNDSWTEPYSSLPNSFASTPLLPKELTLEVTPLFRPKLWNFLAQRAFNRKETYIKRYYSHLLEKPNPLLLAQVDKDIRRTGFSTASSLLEGKTSSVIPSITENLRNILLAYAKHDQHTGYMQGMNFIAAGILVSLQESTEHLEKLKSKKPFFETEAQFEEFCFWVLDFLFREREFRKIFDPNLGKIEDLLNKFEQQLDENGLLFVSETLKSGEIGLMPIFGGFFFTAGLNRLPLELISKTLDGVLSEGTSFISRILIFMMVKCSQRLRELSESPIDLYEFLAKDLVPYFLRKFPNFESILFS